MLVTPETLDSVTNDHIDILLVTYMTSCLDGQVTRNVDGLSGVSCICRGVVVL